MAKKTAPPTPRPRGPSHTGPLYEITEDFSRRFERLLETKSQADVARELGSYLSVKLGEPIKVDASSISHLRSVKYPSSRWAGPVAEMYKWPIPPIARDLLEGGHREARLSATISRLERLLDVNPTRYEHLETLIEGEALTVEGELLSNKASAALRGERAGEQGVRGAPSSSTQGDKDDDGE